MKALTLWTGLTVPQDLNPHLAHDVWLHPPAARCTTDCPEAALIQVSEEILQGTICSPIRNMATHTLHFDFL